MNRKFFLVFFVLILSVCSIHAVISESSYEEAESKWTIISSGRGWKKYFFDGKVLYDLANSNYNRHDDAVLEKTLIKEFEFEGADKNVEVKKTYACDQSGSNFVLIELENGSFYLFYLYDKDDFNLVKISNMQGAKQVDCTPSSYKSFCSIFIRDDRLYCATFSYEDKKTIVKPFPFMEKAVEYKVLTAVTTSMGYCIFKSNSSYGVYFFTIRHNGINMMNSGFYFSEVPDVKLSYGPNDVYSVAFVHDDMLHVFENKFSGEKCEIVHRKNGVRKLLNFIDYDFARHDEKESLFIYEYEDENGVVCLDVSSQEKNLFHVENVGTLSIFPNDGELGVCDFLVQAGNSVTYNSVFRNHNYYDWTTSRGVDDEEPERFVINEIKSFKNAFLYKTYPLLLQFFSSFDENGNLDHVFGGSYFSEWDQNFYEKENSSKSMLKELAEIGKDSECIRPLSRNYFSIRNPQTGHDILYEIYGESSSYYLKKYELKGRVIGLFKAVYLLVIEDLDEFKYPLILDVSKLEMQYEIEKESE